jgi:hypothetical protein
MIYHANIIIIYQSKSINENTFYSRPSPANICKTHILILYVVINNNNKKYIVYLPYDIQGILRGYASFCGVF